MTENGGREIKLNLGSGKNYREGYINIEINPRFKSDVLANIMDVEYPEGSIDEVSQRIVTGLRKGEFITR